MSDGREAVIREMRLHESRTWDDFVMGAENGHALQGWAWGELKRRYGWQPVRLALIQDGNIRAGAQVLLKSARGFSAAYVPRGPVVAASEPGLYVTLLTAIHRLARSRHSIFLKIEPNERHGSEIVDLLRGQGFLKSRTTFQPRATLFVDLDGGPDAVWARLKRKTRHNVRVAERRGVAMRYGSTAEDLEAFHRLMVITGERNGFGVRSLGYFRDVLREFRERGQAELLLAESDGSVVAGMIVFAYGSEGLSLYGASDPERRRDMPNYLRHWKAMQWCMERGCDRYDLWGIPEAAAGMDVAAALEQKSEHGGLWGVYAFKQHFGDIPVRYTGAYDYAYSRPLYHLWTRVRKNRGLVEIAL